jgi:hypothetical protein
MGAIERRLETWYDIQEPVAGPVTLASSLTVQGTATFQNAVNISMSTPTLTLTYPGTNTVSIQLTSSAQKLVTSWGPYLTMQSSGNYLGPVYTAKQISTVSLTATATLDQTFVLASSLRPNTQLLLYLTVTLYNNGGYTTCVAASFSNATVSLCTTSTSAVTLTGSATVTTLTNGWLTLSLSSIAGGTAYVSNACAVLTAVAS